MATGLDSSFDTFSSRLRPVFDKALGVALLDAIWGIAGNIGDNNTKRYLKHYTAIVLHKDSQLLPFRTHRDVIELIELVKNGRILPLQDLRASIAAVNPVWLADRTSGIELRAAIGLAVDLWLMVDTQLWVDDNIDLCNYVRGRFPQRLAQPNPVVSELTYTARSLEMIGGVELEWTSRITEHLRLDSRSGRVCVFRHASFAGQRRDDGQE